MKKLTIEQREDLERAVACGEDWPIPLAIANALADLDAATVKDESGFHVGDPVSKTGGDYRFDGIIVSVFAKLSGVRRYVAEDDRGILHIYSDRNLKPRP